MESGQMCRGMCDKYKISAPGRSQRYGEGRARCTTCDVWLDARGAYLKDGSPAASGPVAWFCRCCHCMLRRSPRSARSKSLLEPKARSAGEPEEGGKGEVDLSYFSRYRGELLRRIAPLLPELYEDVEHTADGYARIGVGGPGVAYEFGDARSLLDLAYELDPPNKISLAIEFERIRSKIGRVPTREDIGAASASPEAYDAEFGSWANFLDKMGYDPWRRGTKGEREAPGTAARQKRGTGLRANPAAPAGDSRAGARGDSGEPEPDGLRAMRERIVAIIRDDPDALRIFDMMEADMEAVDGEALRRAAARVESG